MQIYSARVSVIVTAKDSSIIMLIAPAGMLTLPARARLSFPAADVRAIGYMDTHSRNSFWLMHRGYGALNALLKKAEEKRHPQLRNLH